MFHKFRRDKSRRKYIARFDQRGRPQRRGQRLACEPLEKREVLSTTTLGNISGTAFVDTTVNGTFDAGEQLSGAQIQLFRDSNNNNTFDSGTDVAASTTNTLANGTYNFSGVTPGNYFVV
jgi:hypothetical protein